MTCDADCLARNTGQLNFDQGNQTALRTPVLSPPIDETVQL
jgi:hypothetical protein